MQYRSSPDVGALRASTLIADANGDLPFGQILQVRQVDYLGLVLQENALYSPDTSIRVLLEVPVEENLIPLTILVGVP